MNAVMATGKAGSKMSSLEIAETMDKKHFNVMRDIKSLIDQGAIGALNFELSSYTTDQNKQAPLYFLDFDATMTLITGYDAKRRSVVIKRWRELETGIAQSAYQLPKSKPFPCRPGII